MNETPSPFDKKGCPRPITGDTGMYEKYPQLAPRAIQKTVESSDTSAKKAAFNKEVDYSNRLAKIADDRENAAKQFHAEDMKRQKETLANAQKIKSAKQAEVRAARNAIAPMYLASLTIHAATGAVNAYLSATIQIEQATISYTHAIWAKNDALREASRLTAYNFQLDVRYAEIQEKLAERQLLVTQRTGRQLDVQMAQIQVEMAQRNISLAKFAAYDKELKIKRDLIDADLNISLVQKQLTVLYRQLRLNIVSTIAQVSILTAQLLMQAMAHWAVKAAIAGPVLGTAVVVAGLASVGALVAAGRTFAKTASPPQPVAPESGRTSAQTGPGDVKQIAKGGTILAHEGELVMRPGTAMGGKIEMHFNIYGGSGSAEQIAEKVYRRVERGLLHRQPLYYPNANYGVR